MSESNKRTPPFQSKLHPYKNEIMTDWRQRKMLREICEKLETYGIKITTQGLSRFIRCWSQRLDPREIAVEAKPEPVKPEVKAESTESIKARSDRLGELLRREMNRDSREIEWEHFVEENRKGYSSEH